MNFGDFQIPLLIAKKSINKGHVNLQIDRYAGVAFYVGDKGKVVTCRHIIQMVQDDEVLVGKCLVSNQILPISNIKEHPKFDFAMGVFPTTHKYSTFPIENVELSLGQDVRVFGFNNIGKVGENVEVKARLLKGYIVSISDKSDHPEAKSITELSFPSLKGFSGSPLVSTQTGQLVGMMFSNLESSIEVHSFMDVEENGDSFKEGIYRIIELGLAHPVKDIIEFMSELEK
ncbi:S1 family peptidase [Psychromonas sp. L1A2]|uniref:S1 family peptidase n=1 Tax=Psychromonas sp. L1A2 TaxID=2686356 RepID=UPI001359130D|nr:serine protease [Psychromonas sp. L1A2]